MYIIFKLDGRFVQDSIFYSPFLFYKRLLVITSSCLQISLNNPYYNAFFIHTHHRVCFFLLHYCITITAQIIIRSCRFALIYYFLRIFLIHTFIFFFFIYILTLRFKTQLNTSLHELKTTMQLLHIIFIYFLLCTLYHTYTLTYRFITPFLFFTSILILHILTYLIPLIYI